jgi:NAD-dependent deacetylase
VTSGVPPALLTRIRDTPGPIVFLTGAGISAESGIPTFRGPEGYWRVGSRNYHPMEMATAEAFRRMPEEVWAWYLSRRARCRSARPNPAHEALVALERRLPEARFLLVTQNVDGLHLRAGNSLERTYQIHGNIDYCRCADGCEPAVRPLPDPIPEGNDLRCGCGARLRPHVLWFDEMYDEPLFRYESARRAAEEAAALVVVGTSGATTLPAQMCETVAARGAPLLVVDPEETPFARLAAASSAGVVFRGTATEILPSLLATI